MSMTVTIHNVVVTIETGSTTKDAQVLNSVNLLSETSDFNDLFDRVSVNTNEISIRDVSERPSDSGSGYDPNTSKLYLDFNEISRLEYQSEHGGEYHNTTLERTLVHELSHAAMHTDLDEASLKENQARLYTNEFMSKHFSEPRRLRYEPPYSRLSDDDEYTSYSDLIPNPEYEYENSFGDTMTDYLDYVIADQSLLDFIEELLKEFGILDAVNDFFNLSRSWTTPPRRDPLTLDLDGDGIETTAQSGWDGVLFDHNNDGQKTGTGWISGDDGLLVLDRNNNGLIDNGGELFGDNTQLSDGTTAADGFAALADLDSNQDGLIDINDTAFANLRVWQDSNQDGISQADELKTLEQWGIASLSTAGTVSGQTQNGNTITHTGSYT